MIILDTHIWIWWIAGDTESLGRERLKIIESEDIVSVSAISCFEIAWLERHERIKLSCDRNAWFNMALEGSGVTLLPIIPEIAGLAVDLPEHHSDPQDRIIIATSIFHKAGLVSLDKKFKQYSELSDLLL